MLIEQRLDKTPKGAYSINVPQRENPMSIANRCRDLEDRVSRLYAERADLNNQVMQLSREIKDFEEQLTDLEAKRDGVM